MSRLNVEDYLEQGIHGPKEIKPGERREFLGTLRERVVIVLKKSQVFETNVYPEVEQMMKQYPRSNLFLNGQMDYQYLGKYIKLAMSHNIPYKIVLNKEHNSDLGLVLAENNAINKEEIHIEKKFHAEQVIKKKSFKAFFKRFIKKLLNKR
ncbi:MULTISPECIES: YueI family protein [Peribacillus]|uniref:YueI family protein n=1 Tax=Peribacillus TaxID=2675229 RepID=UPI001F4DC108|nr:MULTISPECIES: YueI family protein [unclassified Peribacillus]MCK1982927.1 YueI family protein [Peribacillus sp. Aquil_B1]MCK2008681.1 YueI family protein [Peribacillus sp. Aquil_B8]